MANAEDKEFGTALERAVAFRDGLMIAILAARPLRRGSLAALRLTDVSRRGDTMWMAVRKEANKSRRPVEVPLPSALTPAIIAYLDEHRPALLRGIACDAFWVSKGRRAMGTMAIYMRITKLTRQAFGVAINPHLFRDAAATTIAVEDPAHVRIAATVLGHSSLSVTEQYYDQSQMIHACRRYQEFLSTRRGRAVRTFSDSWPRLAFAVSFRPSERTRSDIAGDQGALMRTQAASLVSAIPVSVSGGLCCAP